MIKEHNTIESIKPFLRWAGGKRWLLKHISTIKNLEIENYYEPFLGGASIFLNIDNYNNAILSDLNYDLIETYISLRDDMESVITFLEKFDNNEKEYYRIRDTTFDNAFERAAKFIFLNKTSFNGIYRVNQKGHFNVPYGFRTNISDLVDRANLELVNKKLQNGYANKNWRKS